MTPPPDYAEMPDNALLELIRQGDLSAQEYLLSKYKGLVRAKARTYFLIGADHEDLIQEGMIGLYKAVRDYDGSMGASFSTFAELCVTRRMLTAIKTANRRKHSPLNSYISFSVDGEDGSLPKMPDDLPGPEDIVVAREERAFIEQNLAKSLSKFEKAVLSCYLNGMSYAETALEYGKPEKSIDNALQRVRKKLDKILNT